MQKFVCFVVLVGVVFATNDSRKIPVSVYYEALCPDSKAFIVKQLTPALQGKLGDHVQLELIPYGKSQQVQRLGNWEFTCHHGEKECYGNKIHACALNLIENPLEDAANRTSLGFVDCLMDKAKSDGDSATYPIKECAEANKVRQLLKIENCSNHTDGSNFLANFGNITYNLLNGGLKSVPTVVFEHKYDSDESKEAQESFVRVLCRHIHGEKPQDCANSAANITVSLFTVLVVLIKQFF